MQYAEEKIAAIPAGRGQVRGDAESAERIEVRLQPFRGSASCFGFRYSRRYYSLDFKVNEQEWRV